MATTQPTRETTEQDEIRGVEGPTMYSFGFTLGKIGS